MVSVSHAPIRLTGVTRSQPMLTEKLLPNVMTEIYLNVKNFQKRNVSNAFLRLTFLKKALRVLSVKNEPAATFPHRTRWITTCDLRRLFNEWWDVKTGCAQSNCMGYDSDQVKRGSPCLSTNQVFEITHILCLASRWMNSVDRAGPVL